MYTGVVGTCQFQVVSFSAHSRMKKQACECVFKEYISLSSNSHIKMTY